MLSSLRFKPIPYFYLLYLCLDELLNKLTSILKNSLHFSECIWKFEFIFGNTLPTKKVEAVQVVFASLRYFFSYSYIWPSYDLEFNVIKTNWPWIQTQWPQTQVRIFPGFSDAFFYTWLSNDLEPDVMEVKWPSHRNQRPQKPLYIQSVSGVPE